MSALVLYLAAAHSVQYPHDRERGEEVGDAVEASQKQREVFGHADARFKDDWCLAGSVS